MVHGIKVRKARLHDLKPMQNLFVDTIREICKHDYGSDQIKVWTSSIENTERWKGRLRDQYVLIAEINNDIVGFGSLRANDYLDLLYVHKDFQKKGIARLLCNEIEQEALRRNGDTLYCDASITARPFFEKIGYRTVTEQKNIIKETEIINFKMVKDLLSQHS